MNPGDLCMGPVWKTHGVNLLERVNEQGDDGIPFESGEKLLLGEMGLILGTHSNDRHKYHLILTPRGTTGWIHEYHLVRFE